MSKACFICPRKCGVDRSVELGFCQSGENLKIARASLHFFEEPCISGKNGSGTVFFSGCNLKCVYCQNFMISSENYGVEVTAERLAEIFLELQEKQAHNINLVTPTHFAPQIIDALDIAKTKLYIPVVYNCGGYESIKTLQLLKGYVDIFLTDFKYKSSELSMKYSSCEYYFDVASRALHEMYSQTGRPQLVDGIMTKGVIIRHLVLPNSRKDSIEILEWLAENFAPDEIILSLMSQFTPVFECSEHPEINRRVSTFEYNKVVDKALELEFKGYIQDRNSADREYTPDFDLTGI